jgi:hemerythrin-like domain-containing protein
MAATRNRKNNRDAISILKDDHAKVMQMLEKLEGSAGRATTSRDKLLSRIEEEIKTHSRLEEEIFYPAYKDAVRKKEDSKLFFEAHEEHHVVDVVMAELMNGVADSETFAAKSKLLKELVEHHVQEEERQMFPRARKAMGSATLKELGQEIELRRGN